MINWLRNRIVLQRQGKDQMTVWPVLLACMIILLALVPDSARAQTVISQVAASDDDAEQDGAPETTIIDVGPTEIGDGFYSGYRFLGLTIPVGATITSASIQFTAESANTSGTPRVLIVGQRSGQMDEFEEKNNNLTSRTTTSASVSWDIPSWPNDDEAGPVQQTPDLSAVIQEIIDRPQWASGNPLILILEPNGGNDVRKAHTWDSSSSDAAILTVTYSTGAPTGADLAVTKVDDQDPVTTGSVFSYMINVTNNGLDDATGVIVTDSLPGQATYQSATPSQGSCAHAGGSPGGTLTCTLGDITNGSSATVELIVQAPLIATTLLNSVSVSGNEADPDNGNDTASQSTTVGSNINRLCYLVADGGNILTEIDTADFNPVTNETTIGPVGVSDIEAIAFNSATGVLYAANAGTFGMLNLSTGAFNSLGSIGTGSGSFGSITFSDVDGLTYDAATGIMFGAHARGGTDVLIQINMATGAHVPNAFGAGIDYVPITPIGSNNITDDIAVDPTTGVMYASVNDGGSTDRLIIVNKTTGATTDVAAITVPDIEGLGTDFSGQLWGTSGTQGVLYEIDKTTGVGSNGRPIDNGTDYESVDCFAVSPTLNLDIAVTKSVDVINPLEGGTVVYTITVNNTGPATANSLQISDALPTGVTFTSATPSLGIYNSSSGNWYIGALSSGGSATLTISATVDAGTAGSTITNTASVAYVSQNDTNGANDSAQVDIFPGSANLAIVKTSVTVRDPLGAVTPAALSIPGSTIEYEVSVTNSGVGSATEVIITDALDANLSFLAGEYNGGLADIEILVGASPAVYCVAEIGSDTNADGCFLNAGGNALTIGIPVSGSYPTGLTIGTTAPDDVAIMHFRVAVN